MTSSYDRVDGRECRRRLLAEADTELMTTQHVYLKLPLPLYLEYVAHQGPGGPTPMSSLSHCSRCSHCSKSTGSDSKHTENDDLDPMYAMYADERPKPDHKTGVGDRKTYSSNMTPTPLVIKKKNSTSTDSRTLEVEDDFPFFSAQDIINHGEGDQKSESACSSGFISEPEPVPVSKPEAVVAQRISSKNIPIDTKKIRRDAIPSKLLLTPKYWQRGISTRLKPPTTAKFNEEIKASVEQTGGFHRLTRPRSVKGGSENPPEHDFLYYPCPGDKMVGVHTVAENVVMESFEHISPLELHRRLKHLGNREIFPRVRTVRIASGIICANGDWSPEMVDSFFGPEHLVLVDLRDGAAVRRTALKLLKLIDEDEDEEPTGKWYRKFTRVASKFRDPSHWEDIEFEFVEAWFNATWKLPYTKVTWPKEGWREEIVPSAALEDPRTRHHFKDAVVDEQEDFRSLDSEGAWDRTTPYTCGELLDMPTVSPVFAFVRPENWESMRNCEMQKRSSAATDLPCQASAMTYSPATLI
ncbi:hypothetical protein KJ359_001000 [Pestalotiopsis sp. 9143b]|nr:hypothetical protein KJ359_001000 [Pestalotiopsis sp. 9143b]